MSDLLHGRTVSFLEGAAAVDHPEVIARLHAIEAAAPRTDGVVCFARLYRQVTEGVNAELASQTLSDGRFLERLDVLFAGLFFSALDAYERDRARRGGSVFGMTGITFSALCGRS